MLEQSPTLQGLRAAVFQALTVPLLTYQIDQEPIQTVPAANIVAKSIWNLTAHFAPNPPPMPSVAFAVTTVARRFSRALIERELRLQIWIVSDQSTDDVTMLYEAIRSRIYLADQDAPPGVSDLSRAASSTQLSLTVRACVEIDTTAPDFNDADQRFEMQAEYSVVAR
jgi:hypothetical protein